MAQQINLSAIQRNERLVMEIFYIAACVLSVLCLFSFLVYTRHFSEGHWSIYELNQRNNFSLPRKILLWLAFIGLAVCIYSGIDLMLFWFPKESGFINGEGEYTTYKTIIITPIFLFAIGFTLVSLITMAEDQKKGIYYEIIADGYKKILEANMREDILDNLKNEFEDAAKKLRIHIKNEADRFCKKGWQLQAYEDLLYYAQGTISTRNL